MISAQSRPPLPLSSQNIYQSYTLFPPNETASSASSVSGTSEEVSIPEEVCTADTAVYMERVRVPSTAHVAQIVGKQGAKIKLLRQKSKTYIQTPTPGEEPVFTINGDIVNVIAIREEILKAASHFTAVQEEKQKKLNNSKRTPGSHQVLFEVPMYLVGLIVGKNGSNVRIVQQQTGTYIETPKRGEKPIFKITGQRGQVFDALAKIQTHAREKSNLNFKLRHKNDVDVELYKSNDE